ncbi:MAG: hypothetical protein H6715_03225 [Myxococcales bacterium]|nr:hypothetical protein [Myxococcales bacterium]
MGIAVLGSLPSCKATLDPKPPEKDASFDADALDAHDAAFNDEPIDISWYLFDSGGTVRDLMVVRGTMLFRFNFIANAGTGEWLEPLDLQENWGAENAPFETSTAPLDAAWFRYDDTQGSTAIRKLYVIRNRILHEYDYTTSAWSKTDISTNTVSGTGWASASGPFGNNNPAPVDAAWYRHEEGNAAIRRLAIVRGTTLYAFEYSANQWTTPVDLAEEGSTWKMPGAPFGTDSSPIDAAWYRYEGTGENKIELLNILRSNVQYTYNFLKSAWNPPLTHNTGNWTDTYGPFSP